MHRYQHPSIGRSRTWLEPIDPSVLQKHELLARSAEILPVEAQLDRCIPRHVLRQLALNDRCTCNDADRNLSRRASLAHNRRARRELLPKHCQHRPSTSRALAGAQAHDLIGPKIPELHCSRREVLPIRACVHIHRPGSTCRHVALEQCACQDLHCAATDHCAPKSEECPRSAEAQTSQVHKAATMCTARNRLYPQHSDLVNILERGTIILLHGMQLVSRSTDLHKHLPDRFRPRRRASSCCRIQCLCLHQAAPKHAHHASLHMCPCCKHMHNSASCDRSGARHQPPHIRLQRPDLELHSSPHCTL